MKKAVGKYVTVKFPRTPCGAADLARRCIQEDASSWVYKVPKALRGKVGVGDAVIVEYADDFKVGIVAEPLVSTHLRPDQVGTIIDRVRIAGYLKHMAAEEARDLLLADMQERQTLIERMEGYRASAQRDGRMRELIEQYDKLA